MRLALVLALCGLAFQDAADPRIEALDDESIAVREEAQDRLAREGAPVLPALRAAALGDSDRARRARIVIGRIEDALRLADEARQDAACRDAALGAVALDGRLPSASTDGAAFFIVARPWKEGTVLETTISTPLQVDFGIGAIVDGDGKELAIERCGACSPRLVYVPVSGPVRPILRGVRRWFSRYEVTFEAPADHDRRKVGDFTIEVAWPVLKITSERGWPAGTMARVASDFHYELKVFDGMGYGRCGGRNSCRGMRVVRQPPGWCPCAAGPCPWSEPMVPLVRTTQSTNIGATHYRLDQIARITLQFFKPVEEAFELAGPALEAQRP